MAPIIGPALAWTKTFLSRIFGPLIRLGTLALTYFVGKRAGRRDEELENLRDAADVHRRQDNIRARSARTPAELLAALRRGKF